MSLQIEEIERLIKMRALDVRENCVHSITGLDGIKRTFTGNECDEIKSIYNQLTKLLDKKP